MLNLTLFVLRKATFCALPFGAIRGPNQPKKKKRERKEKTAGHTVSRECWLLVEINCGRVRFVLSLAELYLSMAKG